MTQISQVMVAYILSSIWHCSRKKITPTKIKVICTLWGIFKGKIKWGYFFNVIKVKVR
jgi:hypothetical protein